MRSVRTIALLFQADIHLNTLLRRCRRCGKRWCGTDAKLMQIYGTNYDEHGVPRVTYGSKKCRKKGPKR